GSALFFFTASSVVITAPSPPDSRPTYQAKNTKFRTVPNPGQSPILCDDVVEILMLSHIYELRIFRVATSSPASPLVVPEGASALLIGDVAALLLFATIMICLGSIVMVTRRWRFRDLTIFSALMVAIASLVLVAAIVWLIALVVLGFPSLPSPSGLTLSQLGGVVQVGLSVAAAVGVAVALLVTYRKQRDSEAAREADLFRIAVEQLGSDQYFMRITGVLALRDLADRWESWRQRCLDMLCVAIVQPGEGSEGIRRLIYEILRERFDGQSRGWRGCSITIAHGEIPELDLSNLVLHGGTLTLQELTISQPANLSAVRLTGGARLVLDGLCLTSTLNLNKVVCSSRGSLEMRRISIGVNGVLDLSEAQVARGGTARVQKLTALDGGQFLATDLWVKGLVELSDLTCDSGASIDLANLICYAGRVSISEVHSSGGDLSLAGAEVHKGGYLRVDRYFGHDGRLSLIGGRVRDASVVSLTNIMVYDGTCLDLTQLYNKSGSLFYAHVVVNAGVVNLTSLENEDKGSVFILRAHMEGKDGRVHFRGGGNYGGDVHIEAYNFDRSVPAGTFRFEDVNLPRGQIELKLAPEVKVLATGLRLQESETVVRAGSDATRKLYLATQPRATQVLSNPSHDWSIHLTQSPLGRPIRWHNGEI
ncbi:hypothetical protein ACX80Z_15910, partial [Arthrobacter sp. TMT4-20]